MACCSTAANCARVVPGGITTWSAWKPRCSKLFTFCSAETFDAASFTFHSGGSFSAGWKRMIATRCPVGATVSR
ncbi:hypothetical protein ACFU53_32905 [Streptomyces sp. NPDC057474]|uniref:hypothetical protein n=1 Tax=Streptomyces sp. NPDC057474 TaxID=3346144 RepID=UPI0036C8D1B9